jgi:hypothetical protein
LPRRVPLTLGTILALQIVLAASTAASLAPPPPPPPPPPLAPPPPEQPLWLHQQLRLGRVLPRCVPLTLGTILAA